MKLRAILYALIVSVLPVSAQNVCAMKADITKMLESKYKETSCGSGLVGDRAIVEIFVSDKGTFTIVSSFPDGVACIIAAGNSWEAKKCPKHETPL